MVEITVRLNFYRVKQPFEDQKYYEKNLVKTEKSLTLAI